MLTTELFFLRLPRLRPCRRTSLRTGKNRLSRLHPLNYKISKMTKNGILFCHLFLLRFCYYLSDIMGTDLCNGHARPERKEHYNEELLENEMIKMMADEVTTDMAITLMNNAGNDKRR